MFLASGNRAVEVRLNESVLALGLVLEATRSDWVRVSPFEGDVALGVARAVRGE